MDGKRKSILGVFRSPSSQFTQKDKKNAIRETQNETVIQKKNDITLKKKMIVTHD